MRRELFVELGFGNDGTLTGFGTDGELQLGHFLRWLVVDLGGGEVEVAVSLRPHHGNVGHVGLRGDAVDGGRQLTSDDGEGLRVETVVDCGEKRLLLVGVPPNRRYGPLA